MANNYECIKTQKFGIEIEMTGLTRAKAAKAVAKHFNTTAEHLGGSYDTYIIRDNQNRKWKIVYDASILCRKRDGSAASNLHSVELVSPICEYGDIGTIQQLVRDLRASGGVCNQSTGIHIHVNAAPYDAQKLRNLVNIIASKEDMLYKALQVDGDRQRYCQKTDQDFLEKLNARKPRTLNALQNIWYNGSDGRDDGNTPNNSSWDIPVRTLYGESNVDIIQRVKNGARIILINYGVGTVINLYFEDDWEAPGEWRIYVLF